MIGGTSCSDEERQGKRAYDQGKYPEALVCFTRALKASPGDTGLLCKRAEVFRALREFQNALDDATRAIEVNPADSHAHYELGLTHFGLGDLEASVQALERSLSLSPREIVRIRLAEVREQLKIDANRRSSQTSQADDGASSSCSTTAIDTLVLDWEASHEGAQGVGRLPRQSATRYLLLLADEAFANHQLEDAKAFYTAAIATHSTKESLSKRSTCYLEMGRYKQALADACQCVELDPHWAQGYFDKGCAEAALFQFASARQNFEEVERLEPGHRAAWQRLQMLKAMEKKHLTGVVAKPQHLSRPRSAGPRIGRTSLVTKKNRRRVGSCNALECDTGMNCTLSPREISWLGDDLWRASADGCGHGRSSSDGGQSSSSGEAKARVERHWNDDVNGSGASSSDEKAHFASRRRDRRLSTSNIAQPRSSDALADEKQVDVRPKSKSHTFQTTPHGWMEVTEDFQAFESLNLKDVPKVSLDTVMKVNWSG
mmetsp:Transcript_26418/g.57367  ORF Transcript_26418/g.57367 Transcript_26418/m.57367 type:complete len:487 (+) Transcript_26418:145-1605(+)